MGFLATATTFIDSKIRNKTPKVLKIEHADVEQSIVNEICKTTTYDDNTKGLIVNEVVALAQGVSYQVNFKKIGKTVFYNGYAKGIKGDGFGLRLKNLDYYCFGDHALTGNFYDQGFLQNTDTGNMGKVSVFVGSVNGATEIFFSKPINDVNFKSISFFGNYETLN